MAKFRRKGTFKKILAGALAVVLGVGAIAGVSALIGNKADDDGKITINPKWSIGGLDDNGKYEESDATLYTKDAFECQGLTIKPNFDSNVKYQVFFYDELGEFVSATEVLETSYEHVDTDSITHARLEVTPVWGEDVKEKDQVIKWYNKHQWEGQLEIKVNEEQKTMKFQDYETYSLTNSLFTTREGVYYTASGEETASETYNSYLFTATGRCKVYLDCSNSATFWQYNIIKDGVSTRYQSDVAGFISGEENAFELNAGDKVYISVMTTSDLSTVKFYLSEYSR